MRTYRSLVSGGAVLLGVVWSCLAFPQEHFNPAGAGPSEHTRALQAALRDSLPFEDERDFEESRRGLIAEPASRRILGAAGNVVWDMSRYDFLLADEEFDSIHPSLQRQALLNMNYGLYEVVPDFIYQVRGFDLANMTLIRGDTGWILFDVLLTAETAAAALALADETLGELPVRAVVYSHSHIDHFGGVLGVITEDQVNAGEVQVIAPLGFMQEAVSENVYAGTAMSRRAVMQYGRAIPSSPFGQVDSAIGKGLSAGTTGLIAPTVVIRQDFEEHVIDGVRIVFQNTPGTEAPAEMNAWFPDRRVFWAAENISATVHNVYTLRGALVRDALQWARKINEALYRFGREAVVMISSHNWPRWGNDRIQQVMRAQRDAYANLNNQVLHLANQGVTVNEIHNRYRVPESLQRQWSVRQYHGSEFHNSRAVLNRYLGYWDANPATLAPLSPADSAPLYVEMMGGAEPILERARVLHEDGQYRLAMEILNKLVYAEPGNREAKNLLAAVFEQLGYQYESASMRNVFLAAAQELRNGMPRIPAPRGTSPSLARAMTTSQWWDSVAIRVDSARADGMDFTMNFLTPDTGQQFVVECERRHADQYRRLSGRDAGRNRQYRPRATERGHHGQYDPGRVVAGRPRGSVQGDAGVLAELSSVLVNFAPGFEILPGTAN